MTQKIAAEAELSQKAGKQSQLCVELDNALLQELVLSEDNNTLCGLLTLAEGEIKQVGLLMDQSEKSREWVKALKLKLEEAQGQAQKLQMQKSQLEQQNNSNNIELTSTKDKLKKAKSELKQLKSDHFAIQELLKAMQMYLELMEQKYSLAHQMYECTKEKLGAYKD
ncbi:hypothetical protein B0J17DRAFT_626546 [Rhizoctonia solani]|nr:hypothetical protein B0J17DRAFT_626546 [Rhizoctonia solani]